MKSMTRVLLCITAITLSTQSLYAGCLDKVPTSQVELDKRIREAKGRLESATMSEQMYSEIARDAEVTHSQSKALITSSVAGLFGVSAAGTFIAGLVGGSTSHAMLGAAGAGVMLGDVSALIANLKRMAYSDIEIDNVVKKLLPQIQGDNFTCSYATAQEKLKAAREKVFNTKLSGTTLNRIHNAMALGALDLKGTVDLTAISAIEKDLAARELKELQSLSLTAPRSAQTTSRAGVN
ncbi:MAG: hypothetical protein EOP09_20195 [Proteobacteria bacterium]|nr:MAG: hypothetical protein EOP09_20195 [Pseudomonadota bacterium]